jgi:3'(2'), 5'-bisphosphate nucleotidase
MSSSSSSSSIDIVQLLSACVDATRRAGALIRKVWKSGKLDIKMKGHDDPMTVADEQSQQLIVGALRNTFGEHLQIVGEEDCKIPPCSIKLNCSDGLEPIFFEFDDTSKRHVPMSDVCVFIDPLDATLEFTRGNVRAVMTLVGISVRGRPVAGVCCQPFVDANEADDGTMMYGLVGVGVYGVPTTAPTGDDANETLRLVCSARESQDTDRLIEAIGASSVERTGGAGYKIYMVLAGLVDVYAAYSGTKKWDTAAPEALLRAAGGQLTTLAGDDLPYFVDSDQANTGGFLVTMNSALHQRLLLRIQSRLN